MAIDFDPNTISGPMRSTMLAMHGSDAWLTLCEMSAGPDGRKPTGMALTLLSIRTGPWVERQRTRWGGEVRQKRGAGYEYRLTSRGREVIEAMSQGARA